MYLIQNFPEKMDNDLESIGIIEGKTLKDQPQQSKDVVTAGGTNNEVEINFI